MQELKDLSIEELQFRARELITSRSVKLIEEMEKTKAELEARVEDAYATQGFKMKLKQRRELKYCAVLAASLKSRGGAVMLS